jgi:hypothetical protein
MNPYTGTFPAAAQIGTGALDRLLVAMVTSGRFPTVFLRNTPGNPLPRDLYLCNLRTALPDPIEGVPNALAVEFSWMMQGELNDIAGFGSASVAGSVTIGPEGEVLLDFEQIPMEAVNVVVSEEGAPWSAPVIQAGFWVGLRAMGAVVLVAATKRPTAARVLSGPDGRALHLCVGLAGTEPIPFDAPPSVMAGKDVALIASQEPILTAALQAVLQLTAGWKFGTRLIYDADVVLDSFAWTWAPPYLHGEGTAHQEVTDFLFEIPATFSIDVSFFLGDPPQPGDDRPVRVGISDVKVDVTWWADLIADVFLTPIGGIALVESIEHGIALEITKKSKQKLGQAFADMNPLQQAAGGKLLVRNTSIGMISDGLVLHATVLEQVGQIDPIDRIPMILGNPRSKIFHHPDCVYGRKVFGPEKFLFDSTGVAKARAKYNGCWTCMRKWHRRAAGDVTVILRATDTPNGKPTFPLRLTGEPIELFDEDGFGAREPFVKEMQIEAQADEHGVVLVKTKLPQLAAGYWKIVAGTELLPSWSAQGERRVSKASPAAPLYFRPGKDGADPFVAEPLDAEVLPARARLAIRLSGFLAEDLDGRMASFTGKLVRPVEIWGHGLAEFAATVSILSGSTWIDANTLEVAVQVEDLLPGDWELRLKLPELKRSAYRTAELSPGASAQLHLGTW